MTLRLTVRTPSGTPFHVTLDGKLVTVGRASTCHVRIPYPVVSSHHLDVTRRDGRWYITDVGSTNGTYLGERRLPIGEPMAVEGEVELAIVDVRLEFEPLLEPPEIQAFTLAQTGTMARQMISDALDMSQGDDLAFFEIVAGVGAGTRAVIPDELEEGWIGSIDGALLTVPDPTVPRRIARVARHGDGFRIEADEDAELLINSEPPRGPRRLHSRDRLAIGEVEIVFFDPLEAYLADLDTSMGVFADEPPLEQTEVSDSEESEEKEPGKGANGTIDAEAAPPLETMVEERPTKKSGLRPLEVLLLIGSIVIFFAGSAAILLVFDVI